MKNSTDLPTKYILLIFILQFGTWESIKYFFPDLSSYSVKFYTTLTFLFVWLPILALIAFLIKYLEMEKEFKKEETEDLLFSPNTNDANDDTDPLYWSY